MATVGEIQRLALSLVGSPYVLGCEPWYDVGYEPSNVATASDCSGLVYAVFRRAGVPWKDGRTWPRLTAHDYSRQCTHVPRSQVRCGDVALFAGSSGHVYHIALCIDHDRTVEARGRRWGVVCYDIDDPANGVVKRGAYFGRFPWVTLDEEDEMTKDQDMLLRQLRLSTIKDSADREITIALLKAVLAALGKPVPAEVASLERKRDELIAQERRRLGL